MTATLPNSALLQAAVQYAERGWRVVALHTVRNGGCTCGKGVDCGSPGKHPQWHTALLPNGEHAATTDIDLIQKWWEQWPDANVGIVPGGSGIFVIDLDRRPDKDGVAEIHKWQDKYGPLPLATPMQVTGSGGLHIVFKVPADGGGIPSTNNNRKIARGVDVRGNSGLIVAAPSLHISGQQYSWVNEPGEYEPADAPEWLVKILRKETAAPIAHGNGNGHHPEVKPPDPVRVEYYHSILRELPTKKIPGVDRSNLEFDVFRNMYSEGFSRDTVWEISKDYGKVGERGRSYFDVTWGNAIARVKTNTQTTEVEPWEPPTPLGEFDLPAFPLDALPTDLRRFVEAVADCYQVAPDMPAMLALGFLSLALAKRVEVEVKPGYVEPVNIWVDIVLASGERKSAVYREFEYPIDRYEERQAEQYKAAIDEFRTKKTVLEKQISHLELEASRAKDAAKRDELFRQITGVREELNSLYEYRVERHIADDFTTERITGLMLENGGRIGIASSEGGLFDAIGRYSKNNTLNLDPYLKGYSGDPIRVDRIGRAPEYIQQPAITQCICMQPEVLRGLMLRPALRGRGMLARYFYCIPESRVGYRRVDSGSVPQSLRAAYNYTIETALGIVCNSDERGRPEPVRLTLSDEARSAMLAYAAEIEAAMRPGAGLAAVADWAAKIVGGTIRIAGILHSVGLDDFSDSERVIGGDTMHRAIMVGQYLCEHALAAFHEMGADPETETARRVLARIKADHMETLTRAKLFRKMQGIIPKAADLVRPLEILVDHGYLREAEPEARKGPGRRPSGAYLVNPQVHSLEPLCQLNQ